jgi:SAM-dependent methyltransferase
MGAHETEHWWFIGRRAVLDQLIRTTIALPQGARILEAGCGTGGNLAMLAGFGLLDAFELDEEARQVANARGLADVRPGVLPDGIDAEPGRYDLVALLDVLEHIDDDRAALRALGRTLTPTGRLLISVPAMPWLWSHHDEIHHHKRRYTRTTLGSVVEDAGLRVHSIGHFNTLLFPVAVAQRLLQRVTGRESTADELPPPALNAVLRTVFRVERHVVGRVPLPVGLSLYAIAGPAR